MAEFDDERIKRIVALAEKAKEKDRKEWTAESIFERLDIAIIGNERYKKSLAICIADFIGEVKIRNHLLVTGPSGTGKTYLLEQCLPDFGIPYHTIDASSLVPSGYKGNTLQESLEGFFKSNMTASRQCLIVLDEFDKISEKSNGGDTHKSHSIQSELLTLIQGKQEGSIDTRNALWVFAGAFAYTDEMKTNPPKLSKNDLLKYGFKNELLGRITKLTMTDIPTVEQVVRRVANDKIIAAFIKDLGVMGYQVDFTDEAFLELAMAAQNPNFGMRIIPTVIAELKEFVVFNSKKGPVIIEPKLVKEALNK
jgi:ATP-dependent Clp protease ATP-binding subunit ClpX